jgi:Tfp pilus assembly protein PilF
VPIRERFGDAVAAIVVGCSDSDVTPKPPWRVSHGDSRTRDRRVARNGEAYLRIGEAVRDHSTAVASARRIFLTALLQARERRDAAAAATAAAAFASLGDREMADRGFAIAMAVATERGDTAGCERIAALQREVTDAPRMR